MKSRPRPRIVTWIAAGVLILSILFMIRLALSFRLPELLLSIPKWYLPLTGAIWGFSGLIVSIGLFLGYAWAPKVLCWGSLCFVVWYWADRLVFIQSEYGLSTWPAAVFTTLIALLIIFLSQWRSEVKAYFQEKTE